ncbi:MAG: hypothetical protein J7539_10970 [Niabella sp.]|nr:hypothetical protein [Niabella sp.]
MNLKFSIFSVALTLLVLTSCSKWSDEKRDLYQPPAVVVSPISDAAPLHGGITGTMLAGKTYTIDGDVTIKAGDTVFVQPGAHINIKNQAGLFVKGSLISLGSKDAPVWFTVDSLQKLKNDRPNQDPTKDPAFAGGWVGIYCDTSCYQLILKWTHIEFAGNPLTADQGSLVHQKSGTAFSILFQNPNGIFVMEDSWLYGGVDDPIRISNGRICFMRNTFEKGGAHGGDCLNAKGGTVGDMAYNLFVGMATNGQKASNKGIPAGASQTNIRMWNNTFVHCGYRQIQIGRGGDIDFEEGAKGIAYNNLIVNCKFGIRIVSNPAADTANISYGYNYSYGDSLAVVNQIYPTNASGSGGWTRPQSTDIPAYTAFLPAGYKYGDSYDGTPAIQKNNPLFVNFPLPVPNNIPLYGIQAVANYDFRLQVNSPAIGKGYINFSPLAAVPIDPKYGATEITLPGRDIGAFQFNGTGNQHHP